MFDLFGNVQEHQKALEEKLSQIELEETSSDGSITIKVNATRRLLDISIDPEKIDLTDAEQLEDLILITINKALEKAEIKAAAEAKKQMEDLLPPGMANLLGG